MKPLFLSHFDRMTTILANINLFDADDFLPEGAMMTL
jgi:hypothetical protein